jgi:Caspase recruitment domain
MYTSYKLSNRCCVILVSTERRLRSRFRYLLAAMDPSEQLLDNLYEERVLNEKDLEDIKRQHSRELKNEVLLLLLMKRRAADFELFVQKLDSCGQSHIADEGNYAVQRKSVICINSSFLLHFIKVTGTSHNSM